MSSNSEKKILCFNMLNNKSCGYNNKCVYAHSLSDQKIEPIRHKAYTIIKSMENLSNIDLVADPKLYEALLQLTKMCSLCNKSLCPGGYNCRNGAINMKSKICYEDFMFGNCKRTNCLAVHLTKRGFIPYNKQKNGFKNKPEIKEKEKEKEIDIKVNTDLNKYNYANKNKLYEELDNVEGILLTENFFLSRNINNDDDTSISEDEEDIKNKIDYFNNDDDSADESIFLV